MLLNSQFQKTEMPFGFTQRNEINFLRKIDQRGPDECWPWLAYADKDGYGVFGYAGRNHQAHRIAYQIASGDIAPGMVVCHRCDNPKCCNPAHLRVGTVADNNNDARAKGRWASKPPRGERHHRARITDRIVVELRALNLSGFGYKKLASQFGISRGAVRAVITGRTWRHVPS